MLRIGRMLEQANDSHPRPDSYLLPFFAVRGERLDAAYSQSAVVELLELPLPV